MTNLETNFLEVLTREAVRFCSRAVWLFLAPLAQMRTALILLLLYYSTKPYSIQAKDHTNKIYKFYT